ncbi:MAG: glycosyltransferase family 2 protein [Candidatus Gracilibacteria bacterium]|nr:glycosyltransferase family 2 protein [bacterium]MDZ4217141.1 glycosyltransferase family 2 protein [Candidatus Gracilibacteria bacterium]
MKLSICVVNYHSEKELRRFLESLTDYPPRCLFEVVLVHNGGQEEELRSLEKKFGGMMYIIHSRDNQGFGAAQNKAVQKAKGEYVFICNPDLEVDEDSFQSLLSFAEELPEFGVIGPQLVHEGGVIQESCRRFPRFIDLVVKRVEFLPGFKKRARHYLMRDRDLSVPTQVDWLVGAAMLMKRERFLELGGFDPRFFLFFEDTDLCRRVHVAGHDVWYYPDSIFLHAHERLSQKGWWPFSKTFWIHFRSALQYFWKWRGSGGGGAGFWGSFLV